MIMFSWSNEGSLSWWKYCLECQQLGSGWDAELLDISSWSKLFAYGVSVVIGGLRVKVNPGKRNKRNKTSSLLTLTCWARAGSWYARRYRSFCSSCSCSRLCSSAGGRPTCSDGWLPGVGGVWLLAPFTPAIGSAPGKQKIVLLSSFLFSFRKQRKSKTVSIFT